MRKILKTGNIPMKTIEVTSYKTRCINCKTFFEYETEDIYGKEVMCPFCNSFTPHHRIFNHKKTMLVPDFE